MDLNILEPLDNRGNDLSRVIGILEGSSRQYQLEFLREKAKWLKFYQMSKHAPDGLEKQEAILRELESIVPLLEEKASRMRKPEKRAAAENLALAFGEILPPMISFRRSFTALKELVHRVDSAFQMAIKLSQQREAILKEYEDFRNLAVEYMSETTENGELLDRILKKVDSLLESLKRLDPKVNCSWIEERFSRLQVMALMGE